MKAKLIYKLFIALSAIYLIGNIYASTRKTPEQFHAQARVVEYLINNITWEKTNDNNALHLCILGNTHLDSFNMLHGKNFHNKPLYLKAINTIAGQRCDILFVSESEKDNMPKIIEQTRNKPILTISDSNEFAQQGGDVNLFMANNQPALMLNTQAISEQKLKISSDMLKILTIIPDVEDKD